MDNSYVAVMERPYVADKASERVELRMEPELVLQLEAVAESRGLNRTSYIRMATINQMNQDGMPYRPKKPKQPKESK